LFFCFLWQFQWSRLQPYHELVVQQQTSPEYLGPWAPSMSTGLSSSLYFHRLCGFWLVFSFKRQLSCRQL
jgi:hypothetical protein